MFLVGLAVGAVVNAKWADLVELLEHLPERTRMTGDPQALAARIREAHALARISLVTGSPDSHVAALVQEADVDLAELVQEAERARAALERIAEIPPSADDDGILCRAIARAALAKGEQREEACTCLSYGRGLTATLVVTKTCTVHAGEQPHGETR